MRKFGFKVFSTNLHTTPKIIKECGEFAATKSDVFVEVMAHPDTSDADLEKIKSLLENVEVRIHAYHIGFDPANRENEHQNQKIIAFAQKAADMFNSPTIVVHGGYGHGRKYLEETARQFKLFNDERIVIENLPYCDKNIDDMHGNVAEEIAYVMNECGCGFCFDFSHAICAALSLNMDIETQLKSFYALKPKVYHICDGDITKAEDPHLYLGSGNYPLKHFLNDYTDENAYVTIETGNGYEQHCDSRIADYQYLRTLQQI